MGLVVLRVENVSLVVQGLAELSIDEQLVLDPEGAGLEERGKAAGSDAEIRFQDPLELEQRLVVERDAVELARPEADRGQAVVDRAGGKGRVTLLPGEPFLLRGRDDVTVAQQARGAVVIERGNSEDVGRPG